MALAQHLRTIDTAGSAEEVARLLPEFEHTRQRNYEQISLLTVGYHINNATKLFTRFGVPIKQKLIAEEIIAGLSLAHAEYVRQRAGTDRVKRERQKEFVRFILLHTVDPKGRLIRTITSKHVHSENRNLA